MEEGVGGFIGESVIRAGQKDYIVVFGNLSLACPKCFHVFLSVIFSV